MHRSFNQGGFFSGLGCDENSAIDKLNGAKKKKKEMVQNSRQVLIIKLESVSTYSSVI